MNVAAVTAVTDCQDRKAGEWDEFAPHEPEALPGLLEEVDDVLCRYIAFPSTETRHAIALWVVHAHTIEAFESTPRLALLSAEKGSGKTRTLETLDLLVPRPLHTVNMSAAALFRLVDDQQPTLLMDEADTYLGARVAEKHEELRGLINAGHRRGAVAYRCVGEPSKMKVQEFPAFAAAALAGIGDLPDTILDRSIVVRMKRRAPNERVQPFRTRRAREETAGLRDRLETWGKHNVDRLRDVEPSMPTGVVDRPADVWEPLVAIGDIAGGVWSDRARSACSELTAARAVANRSLGVQLLADVNQVFEKADTDRLSSENLIKRLCELDEAPWADLRGKPLDARGLSARLRPYDVRPHAIRVEGVVVKGYERSDFHDAWVRYVFLPEETVTPVTPVAGEA